MYISPSRQLVRVASCSSMAQSPTVIDVFALSSLADETGSVVLVRAEVTPRVLRRPDSTAVWSAQPLGDGTEM
jgi:hypothetical protein